MTEEPLDFCVICGHGMATCTCGFDCACGCTWGAHASGGKCEDCDCREFRHEAEMTTLITDHSYRPDRAGQWYTGRCDLCGEPRAAHQDNPPRPRTRIDGDDTWDRWPA